MIQELLREMLAELIGTFIIVQMGTAAGMSSVFSDAFGLFPIAVVWGIAVTLAISCTASISGAHVNPAISVAMAAFRSSSVFGWFKVIPYCFAQLLGASLGSAVNLLLYNGLIQEFEAANGIVRSDASGVASAKVFGEYFTAPVTVPQAFFAEAFATAVLTGVVFCLSHPNNEAMKKNPVIIPTLIGMTVAALICTIAPITQAGFNPARDFGPRLVAFAAGWNPSLAFSHAWVYILAPLVGSIAAAAFVDKVLYNQQQECGIQTEDDDDIDTSEQSMI